VARSSSSPIPLVEQLRQVIDEPLALDELDTPGALVPQLSTQMFVRIARRLRDEHRLELLLPHATPEQLTGLLDIDGWNDDRVDVPRVREWLWAIADGYTTYKPRGSLTDLMYEMDPEMWTLAVGHGMTVIDLDPEDDAAREVARDQLEGLRTWETPDGFFVVGVPDHELGRAALRILDLVYADDLAEGRKLALSIQASLSSEVEEDLYRWREGRLADLGFVSREEAVKLFRSLDAHAAADAEPRDFRYLPSESETGLSVLESWSSTELLQRVMGRLPDGEHGRRAREFLLLVNEVMAAQKFPPGSEPLQERAVLQTQATISLGMEMLLTTRAGHPDPEGFLAERVAHIGLRDIFRVGFGALDKLRKAVRTLDRAARISLTGPASLLDRPWGPALRALLDFYPELALTGTGAGTRPLRTLADVARATQMIAEAEALTRLAFGSDGFAVDPVWLTRLDEPERIVLGDLVRTAIIHAHLPGSVTTMAPLTPADLAWAAEHLLQGGELVPEVRRDFSSRCDALGIGRFTESFAETLLTRLRVELLGLERDADGKIDLTRTGGLLSIQQVSMWLTVREGSGDN